ncbi:Uncharacterized protein BP5553_00731 [Venustampulla echinocandica]|uniref:Xylanolytic transcriptional activator regulatory domain-containing protein n=1 Tax=Venustampulla echinocandica TaxID=2656787 RepID=A0A370TYZ8_9HELO|nr:Uncharacterized protein BP5553_00731 [Venustampulla echinocandica]RDL40752.1 Uncharacterized protein BP5553_00731 [Venustampulla echinocandica]
MEFGLGLFEEEVIAALGQDQEERPSKRAKHNDADSPEVEAEVQLECLSRIDAPPAYEQWLDYPAYELDHKAPLFGITRQGSPGIGDILVSDDEEKVGYGTDPQCGLPSFFRPSLGMTTALLESYPRGKRNRSPILPQYGDSFSMGLGLGGHDRLDLAPNFYFYAIKSTLLPIRRVQHDLVILYFQYIHPLFPLVDEYYFMETYRRYRGREQYMDPSDFMIFQAIMAAGFGHISEAQLQRTPYRSVHEGQEAQFDQVKARYWSAPLADPVVLTQICLIISLWSPGPAGMQNNSYWLNMAFKHATSGQLWKSQPTSDGRPCRRRLLWWCCLVRDRVLALGMRRPYRLHKAPFEEEMISQVDFGMEATSPLFTALESKQASMLAFIWLCKLSEIMAAIAVFQRRNKFSREWAGESAGTSTEELQDVRAFDEDLSQWKEGFEAEAVGLIEHGDQDVAVPFSVLRIVGNSLLAVLYSPYLHLSSNEDTSLVGNSLDPLQRMKDAAQGVESSVVGLISTKKSDTLPNWLVSWVTLPAAIYHVTQHVQNNSSPDRVLMPTLNRFMRRTTGAQAMFLTLTKATKEFLQRLKETHNNSSHGTAAAKFGRPLAPAPDVSQSESKDAVRCDRGNRIKEARILAHVTKALDIALENNC